MFLKLSDGKTKVGTVPQIKVILKSEHLERVITHVERKAWCIIRGVVR